MGKERIIFLDVARGIGIILVVFGHVVYGNNYPMHGANTISNFIYSFHMPLFFVLSGMCINDNNKLNKATLRKLARSYLIPYLVWTAIYLTAFGLFDVIRHGHIVPTSNHLAHAFSICGLAPLWFLLALFIAEVVVLAIKPLIQRRGGYWLSLILLVSVSIVSSIWYSSLNEMNIIARNYLMGTLRIFPTSFFVLVGYKCRNAFVKCLDWELKLRIVVIVVLLIVQVCLCLYWNKGIDVQLFELQNPLLYFVKALNGTAVAILVSQIVHSRIIIFLGKKTKEKMILHYPPFYYTVVMRIILGKVFSPNIIGSLIITIVTIVSCILIDRIMSRFKLWDFAMGRKVIDTR